MKWKKNNCGIERVKNDDCLLMKNYRLCLKAS